MTTVESPASSPDLTLGCCPTAQQPPQGLGGPSQGQQPAVTPDLRGGASGGLAAGADKHALPEPGCDQWCSDPDAGGQQAQGVVLPTPVAGGWVNWPNELVRCAEKA
jgi:hypothetical protein